MNKKYNLALFTLVLTAFCSSFALNVFAQKTNSPKSEQVKTAPVKKDVLQNYIEISALPLDKRQQAFIDLSAEERTNIFKFHLVFQFVKRPNLTREQKDLILESVSMITPDAYDLSKDRTAVQQQAEFLGQKAHTLFPKNEVFEIFARLGGAPEDISIIQKYQSIINLPSFPERKIAFAKLSTLEMSNLWKMQLAFYLSKDDELNISQKEFILRLIDFIKPSLFAESKNISEREIFDVSIQKLESEAIALFTDQKAKIIFARLGFSGSCETPKVNTSELAAACVCRPNGGDCSESTVCGTGGCSSTWFGCGFIYLQSCSGECRR